MSLWEFALKHTLTKRLFAVLLMEMVIFSTGCRRASSKEPKYYKSELIQMQKEEEKRAVEKAEKNKKYMSDGYPWRVKKSREYLYSVPCRANIKDKQFSARIDFLAEAIHGKRKCRVRFRE